MAVSKKLDTIFLKIGDKGFEFLIFIIFLTIHSIFAFHMEVLSIEPNEFATAAWTAKLAGNGFDGIVSAMDSYYGWVGAVLYVPVMLLIRNPLAQYTAMLIINGILASLIPVIAYKISIRLGVTKAWQRILVSCICGIYPAVFAHTKFIWNETFTIIFPWLIALILLSVSDPKSKAGRHILSVTLALVMVVSVFAHERMISIVAAALIIIIFTRVYYKKKTVTFSTFIPSLLIFSIVFFRMTIDMITLLRGNTDGIQNTPLNFFTALSPLFTGNSEAWQNLLRTTVGHMYYYTAATWGLGVLGLCLFIGLIKEKKHYKFLMFSAYAYLSVLLSGAVSVLYKFNDINASDNQETLIFGRYIDSVIPLILMSVICYIFLHQIDLKKLLLTSVMLGGIFTAFFLLSARLTVNAGQVNITHILGLHPIRIGGEIHSQITMDGLFLTVSSVFSLMALFIVFVCCTKEKQRIRIMSLSIATISLYAGMYTALIYLPVTARQAHEDNSIVYEVSEFIYNSDDAPPVIALNVSFSTASLLQFLNQNAAVILEEDYTSLPENCFVISTEELDELELGRTDLYIVYAIGEKAIMFAESQRE
ncbi:MAG: hypothetical protein FWD34_00825 [Oscillospiraceae bacterium]|nr:hypothetical protein [Oscillospiraceae bacterium]